MSEKMFPLQTQRGVPPGPTQIPWAVAEIAYGAYAAQYGRSQSLERLAERGGFGWGEMDEFHPNWRHEVSLISTMQARIAALENPVNKEQAEFDRLIGGLDYTLSVMVNYGRECKAGTAALSIANFQTLKHHAEDMIAAGEKILRDLSAVQLTPQPEK